MENKNNTIFQWTSNPNLDSNEACCIATTLHHQSQIPLILSGWLYKMRRKNRGFSPIWDKRWVVIQNGAVSWRHSKGSEVAGSIELSCVENIHKIKSLRRKKKKNLNDSHRKGNGEIMFVLNSRKRTLCLRAKDDDDCDKWVRAIQLQLDLKSGGTFYGPPSGKKNRRKSIGGGDKYDIMLKTLNDSLNSLPNINDLEIDHLRRHSEFDYKYTNTTLNDKEEYSASPVDLLTPNEDIFESSRFYSKSNDGEFVNDFTCDLSNQSLIETEDENNVETMILV